MANIASTITLSLQTLGVGAASAALVGLGKDILDTNIKMETLRSELTGVTGSVKDGTQAFEFIQQIAKDTPFEIDGLTKSFITLQNYGITPTQQVMDEFTNAAAKLGGSQQTLTTITTQMGQAWAKGKLELGDIRPMIEAGLPVWDLLAKATGKSTVELMDMSSKGELTRGVMEKLQVEMGKWAEGSNARAMETMAGKISNLSDAWHQFEDTLMGDKSEGLMKSIVSGWTSMINYATESMKAGVHDSIAVAGADVLAAQKQLETMKANAAKPAQTTGFMGNKLSQDQITAATENTNKAIVQQQKLVDDLTTSYRAMQKVQATENATPKIDPNIQKAEEARAGYAAEANKAIIKNETDKYKIIQNARDADMKAEQASYEGALSQATSSATAKASIEETHAKVVASINEEAANKTAALNVKGTAHLQSELNKRERLVDSFNTAWEKADNAMRMQVDSTDANTTQNKQLQLDLQKKAAIQSTHDTVDNLSSQMDAWVDRVKQAGGNEVAARQKVNDQLVKLEKTRTELEDKINQEYQVKKAELERTTAAGVEQFRVNAAKLEAQNSNNKLAQIKLAADTEIQAQNDVYNNEVRNINNSTQDELKKQAQLKVVNEANAQAIIAIENKSTQERIRISGSYFDKMKQQYADTQNQLGSLSNQATDIMVKSTNTLTDTVSSGFGQMVSSGTANWQQLALNVIGSIESMIAKLLIQYALQEAMGLLGGFFGAGNSLSTAAAGSSTTNAFKGNGPLINYTNKNANGNVFEGGTLQKFASGGVVTGPTAFPTTTGTGLMGEAGPEAIMPLTRSSDGKLGVQMVGSSSNNNGGGNVSIGTVQVTVQSNSNNPTQQGTDTANALMARIQQIARQEIVNQQRVGNSLNPLNSMG